MRHAINLEPDTDVLDGRQLPKLIELWLDDCRSRLPAYTVDGYADKIAYFVVWWADVKAWKNCELGQADIQQFAKWLATTTTARRQPLSVTTQQDVLRRLRQCLRWAYATDRLPVDLAKWVPRLAPKTKRRRVLTVEELEKLLAAGKQAADPLRDTCALAVLIQTGIRRAELRSIQVATIRLMADQSGSLRVVGKRTKANPTGERTVAVDAKAGKSLAAYLDVHGWKDGPLLRNAAGDPVSLKTIERIVDRAADRAGLRQAIQGCHDLRRAFITHWRRSNRGAGYDHLLRMQVGHASDAISDIYDLADEQDLMDVIRGPLR